MINFHNEKLQSAFITLSKKISTASDNVEINSLLEELVTTFLDAEFSSIWFYNKDKFTLTRARNSNTVNEIDLFQKKGILYKCFMTQKSLICNYLASEKEYVANIDNPDKIKIKSKIMLPLLNGDNFIGIVTAYNSINNIKKFNKEDMKVLESLSPYIMNALYKMYAVEEKNNHDVFNIQTTKNIQNTQDAHDTQESSDDILTFVSSFVHDIRTPANTLYGFLELLEEQIEDPRLKSYLNNAKESASFINEMTTSVLDLVSSHKESEQSVIEEVDSIKFFSSIAKSFASNMYSKHIAFNIYIDPLLPKSIKIDALKVKRVLLNLLGNAYKFTPNDKTIEYSVHYVQKSKKIAVNIEDSGIGIPEEKQKEIFQAFKQAGDTTALNYGGTGLGLFISAQYIAKMGGELQLRSKVDEGSSFHFEIPVEPTDKNNSFTPVNNINTDIAIVMGIENKFSANNLAKYIVRMGINKECIKIYKNLKDIDSNINHIIVFQNKIDYQVLEKISEEHKRILIVEEEMFSIEKDELCETCDVISKYEYVAHELYKFINSQEKPKVLIVDDDEISLLLIENILKDEFCDIQTANNGKEALELLIESYKNSMPYSAVFMDSDMPIMNGIEVVKKLREYEEDNNLQRMYIVSISGDTRNANQEKTFFDLLLGKPFKKDEIKKVLYNSIQQKELMS